MIQLSVLCEHHTQTLMYTISVMVSSLTCEGLDLWPLFKLWHLAVLEDFKWIFSELSQAEEAKREELRLGRAERLYWGGLKHQVNVTASKCSAYDWYLFSLIQRSNFWDYLPIKTLRALPNCLFQVPIWASSFLSLGYHIKAESYSLVHWLHGQERPLSSRLIFFGGSPQWFLTFLLRTNCSAFWIRLLHWYHLWLLALWLNPAQAAFKHGWASKAISCYQKLHSCRWEPIANTQLSS